MKIYALLAVILMILVFFAKASYAEDRLFVGVSPPIVDLGTLERGTTNVVKFYAVTVSDKPLLIYLEYENGRLDFFSNHYNNAIFNFSEEDTASWVRFLSNPVELRPQNDSLRTDYESIKGWREVSFLLEIPRNAEPGYHLIRIKPNPQTPSTQDSGTMVVAVTSINIIFNVEGEAQRKGIILDTVNEGYGSNTMKVDTYFQNIGTDTISAQATHKFYDKDNNFVKETISSTQYVKPKEVKSLSSIVPLTGMSLGDYNIITAVSYTTDSAYKNSTLAITKDSLKVVKSEDFSAWIFIFVIIIIAVAIYRWIN
ncbi:MAG: hypothetical protein V1678_00640 [Candidatus Aenigmatarchaeota archaeon]